MSLITKFFYGSALLALATAAYASQPPKELVQKFSKLGSVKEVRETSTEGMYVWMLEKNGKTLVLFNTPDHKSFIKGTIYDLNTKKVTSDEYALASLKYASPDFRNRILGTPAATQPTGVTATSNDEAYSVGFMNLKWKGSQIPEALKLVDGLAGVKEGKGPAQDTLYVFYDPRCVWCHKTYDGLRPYIEKGYTVKWLPTVALGRNDDALALAAAPLQNSKLLDASFKKSANAKAVKPSAKEIKGIDTNLQFLFAYFEKVIPDQKPSVPLAIFLNKTDGKVTHLQGLPDRVVVDVLFGEGR